MSSQFMGARCRVSNHVERAKLARAPWKMEKVTINLMTTRSNGFRRLGPDYVRGIRETTQIIE
jgi:hypothetical protein